MEWLAAVIAVIAFVVGMVRWRGFRIVVGLLVIAAAVVGFGLHLKTQSDERRSASLVKPGDIEVREIELRDEYGSTKAVMTVKNVSEHTVKSITLHARLLDCPNENSKRDQCETIGDSDLTFAATIPPGQVRQADAYARFGGTPRVKGHGGWTYEIAAIRAE